MLLMLLSMTVVPFYDPYFRKSLFSAPTHTDRPTHTQTDIELLAALAILSKYNLPTCTRYMLVVVS